MVLSTARENQMPQIRLSESLSVAQRILRQINKQGGLPKALRDDVDVITYANGREQGYALRCVTKAGCYSIYFAQSRGSDNIVVYAGSQNPFIDNITPEMYAEATYFPCGEHAKAAKHIRKWVLHLFTKTKAKAA